MPDIKEVFIKFAQVGCPGVTEMTGKNFTKLCKDSGILDKKVTTTDLDIEFSKKIPKGKKMTFKDFEAVIQILAAKKGVEADVLFEKIKASQPGMTGTTRTSKVGGVERMTDASLYTGAHKERFNSDGTGKGLEGRTDSADDSGYVGGYKGAGTYDKKTK